MAILIFPQILHFHFFDVRYEINPWMDVENNPQTLKAFSQWRNMIDAIGKAGGIIEHIRPHPDFPDMVFTANAGLIKGKKVVLSNFKYEERQGEQPLFEEWFLKKGYQSILLPDEIHFEGAGDGLLGRRRDGGVADGVGADAGGGRLPAHGALPPLRLPAALAAPGALGPRSTALRPPALARGAASSSWRG